MKLIERHNYGHITQQNLSRHCRRKHVDIAEPYNLVAMYLDSYENNSNAFLTAHIKLQKEGKFLITNKGLSSREVARRNATNVDSIVLLQVAINNLMFPGGHMRKRGRESPDLTP